MIKKRIVYIAHPISGDVKGNLREIRRIVLNINLSEPNIIPFVPYYVDCLVLDDSDVEQRKRGIANDTEIITRGFIDELWLYRYNGFISNGQIHERILCEKMGIPIRIIDVVEGVSNV